MGDVDFRFVTNISAQPDSDTTTAKGLAGKLLAFGNRGSAEAGLSARCSLKQSCYRHHFFTAQGDRGRSCFAS